MMKRFWRDLCALCSANRSVVVLYAVIVLAWVFDPAAGPSTGLQVQQAVVTWVYWAVVIIVSLYSYSQMPKTKTPEAQKARVPVVKDGKPIAVIFGDVWIDDSNILGMKEERQVPIKGETKW